MAKSRESFVDNFPPHLSPLAADPENLDKSPSSIFRINYSDYLMLSPSAIQAIFKKKHILIQNCPVQHKKFSLSFLHNIGGSCDKIIPVQGIILIYH